MRRSTILFLTLALATVLTACGSTDSPTTSMPHTSSGGDMGGMTGGSGHGAASPVAAGARRIEVAATSFAFDPTEITVKVGEDIAIALTATDLLHDFTIDELDAHVSADKGKPAEGGLRADKAGRYTFYCSVAGHRAAGMEGTLVVVPA
ncbi:MAG: cupredoxin domain-containing protein [Acidimicrobiales bacterium]